jgi:multicomponent Na+:H+ antiporter subunit E
VIRLTLAVLTLFVLWLLLSGNYQTWLILSGLGTAIIVVVATARSEITDEEGFPVESLPRGLVYWAWLCWQIVLSSLTVSRIILTPRLPISPTMTLVEAAQTSAVGITTYANSITLTPGTISVEVGERARCVWVHALTRDGADGLHDDPMNERVAWMDGDR